MLTPQRHLNAAALRADRHRALRDHAIIAAQVALWLLACIIIAAQPF